MVCAMEKFTGSFTQQVPIPEDAIEAAVAVLRHGRLHRYNLAAGEAGEVALLEEEFAARVGAKYCLAVASGGYAMATALRALGVKPGDPVLTNAFTLAPVPGAIASLTATPVFVGVTEALTIDVPDLQAKIASSGAKVLLLSHMRGHICDMDELMAVCDGAGVAVVEDCAHTMGAAWRDVPSGRHGIMAAYSTQTYKHLNSGEGGFLITDDAHLMAKSIMLSGSYMLYEHHRAAPPPEAFATLRYETPNVSGRMDNLRAAILRPQLSRIDEAIKAWNTRYRIVEEGLRNVPGVTVIERPGEEHFVGSSIQFLLLDRPESDIVGFISSAAARGIDLKWFGGAEPAGFTSRYDSWRYAPSEAMPKTDRILKGLLDMRLPLTFSPEDCSRIARILRDEVMKLPPR